MKPARKNVAQFEDLRIWQEARQPANDIYRDMRDGERAKDFVFRNQLQSAGISVMNNIAEGFERSTDPDFARFLDIAKGFSGEVLSIYHAAKDFACLSSPIAQTRRATASGISRGIASLINHLRQT
ncbi:MAG: four helix bundle protein [Roseibacillus sp.]